MGPLDLVTPEYRPFVQHEIELRICSEGQSAHYSFDGMYKDCSIVHVEVFGTRTEIEGRSAIIGMMIDNTDSRHGKARMVRTDL